VGIGRARATPDRALTILREGYARGEIERDEFQAKKRDLLLSAKTGAGTAAPQSGAAAGRELDVARAAELVRARGIREQ